MHLKQAFLWGLPAVFIIGVVKWLGDIFYGIWSPVFITFLPGLSPMLQWVIGFVLTTLVVIIMGFLVIIGTPVKELLQRKVKILQILKQKDGLVVLAEFGGDEFLAIVVEEDEKHYKVLNLSAPFPVSGQLLIVEKEKARPTKLKPSDVIKQLTSFGIIRVLDRIYNKHLQ